MTSKAQVTAGLLRLFEIERTQNPAAPGCNARRVIVVAGGERVDVPATASEPITAFVVARLSEAYGAAYLELDGVPQVAGQRSSPAISPSHRPSSTSGDSLQRDALSILRARRASRAT